MEKHKIGTDVTVLSDHAEIPGIGFLPVNSFVLHAEQPVVVDTGLSTPDDLFAVLREAPEGPGFVGPDKHALEELLATFEPV